MTKNCDSCGARLGADATVCDLCGMPVDGFVQETISDTSLQTVDSREQRNEASAPDPAPLGGSVFCNSCGWKNPAEANFCSKCGSPVQKLSGPETAPKRPASPAEVASSKPGPVHSAASAPPKESEGDSSKAVGKQIGIIVISALLVVMALYMVTVMSKKDAATSQTTLPINPGVSEPLASQWVGQQSALREKMNGLEGEELITVKRELVDLYFAAGRFDLAAEETEAIARINPSENEWAVAGNLYYDWMERQDVTQRAPWASRAIAAYQEVLAINPLNLDVRTDMAIAYMYEPQNSMMAIQETNAVLEQDSLHLQANFNRGIMLMQINRLEQAAEQFEKVMRLIGDPEDAIYLRAQELALNLRNEMQNPTT
jgi:ribosomal protein L40E